MLLEITLTGRFGTHLQTPKIFAKLEKSSKFEYLLTVTDLKRAFILHFGV